MVPLGIGQAAVVRVGLAAGARDSEGVRRAGWSALVTGTLFMACSALVFWFAGRFLVGFFLDPAVPENAPVIDLAVAFLASSGRGRGRKGCVGTCWSRRSPCHYDKKNKQT